MMISKDRLEEAHLRPGKRILLELDDGSTVVGVIDGAGDSHLQVDVLDDLTPSDLEVWTVVRVLMVDAAGLHSWPADGRVVSAPKRATVTLMGAETVLQRRHHHRSAVNLPATVVRLSDSGPRGSQPSQIVDLSNGGLRLVGGPIAIGDTLLISVDVRNHRLELIGRVLLAYPDGHGKLVGHVAFLVPAGPSEPAEQLRDYLESINA